MSFTARLVHQLTITRTFFDDTSGSQTEYGQPTESQSEISVRGLVQERKAEEANDYRSAGVEIADHVIYLNPMALYNSDVIRDSSGNLFKITGIRRFEFGHTPHLEVDAMTLTPAGASSTDDDTEEEEGVAVFTFETA